MIERLQKSSHSLGWAWRFDWLSRAKVVSRLVEGPRVVGTQAQSQGRRLHSKSLNAGLWQTLARHSYN